VIAAEWGWIKTARLIEDIRRIAHDEKAGKHDVTLVLHNGQLGEILTTVRRKSA
jgi:hypothetical protein